MGASTIAAHQARYLAVKDKSQAYPLKGSQAARIRETYDASPKGTDYG